MFEEDSETEEENAVGTPEEAGDSDDEKNKKLGPLQVTNQLETSSCLQNRKYYNLWRE